MLHNIKKKCFNKRGCFAIIWVISKYLWFLTDEMLLIMNKGFPQIAKSKTYVDSKNAKHYFIAINFLIWIWIFFSYNQFKNVYWIYNENRLFNCVKQIQSILI